MIDVCQLLKFTEIDDLIPTDANILWKISNQNTAMIIPRLISPRPRHVNIHGLLTKCIFSNCQQNSENQLSV